MDTITSDQLLEQMNKMENTEKNRFLDRIYADYFDKGIPIEVLNEHAKILEMYYDGELIEAPQKQYY